MSAPKTMLDERLDQLTNLLRPIFERPNYREDPEYQRLIGEVNDVMYQRRQAGAAAQAPRSASTRTQACVDCGEVVTMPVPAICCPACARQRRLDHQRERRRLAAGLMVEKAQGGFRLVVAATKTCQTCGGSFTPLRTTA